MTRGWRNKQAGGFGCSLLALCPRPLRYSRAGRLQARRGRPSTQTRLSKQSLESEAASHGGCGSTGSKRRSRWGWLEARGKNGRRRRRGWDINTTTDKQSLRIEGKTSNIRRRPRSPRGSRTDVEKTVRSKREGPWSPNARPAAIVLFYRRIRHLALTAGVAVLSDPCTGPVMVLRLCKWGRRDGADSGARRGLWKAFQVISEREHG